MKIIEKGLKNTITLIQTIEQAGFKSGYSTSDHLQTINQLIEKSCEYQIEVFLAFLDYKKAFDSIYAFTRIQDGVRFFNTRNI